VSRRARSPYLLHRKETLTVKIVISLMFLAGSCSLLALTWMGAGFGYL
jgi:hypothetical protein